MKGEMGNEEQGSRSRDTRGRKGGGADIRSESDVQKARKGGGAECLQLELYRLADSLQRHLRLMERTL